MAMRPRFRMLAVAPLLLAGVLTCLSNNGFAEATSESVTQIVLLGTGTPITDPDRSGPATAIIVNDTPYIIDFGPGLFILM